LTLERPPASRALTTIRLTPFFKRALGTRTTNVGFVPFRTVRPFT
jgi:hypothetical protein